MEKLCGAEEVEGGYGVVEAETGLLVQATQPPVLLHSVWTGAPARNSSNVLSCGLSL